MKKTIFKIELIFLVILQSCSFLINIYEQTQLLYDPTKIIITEQNTNEKEYQSASLHTPVKNNQSFSSSICPPENTHNDFTEWEEPSIAIGQIYKSTYSWNNDYFRTGRYIDSDGKLFLAEIRKNDYGYLWLGELICIKDRTGYEQLLDIKPIPKEKENWTIPWNICSVDSEFDDSLIAWGRFEKGNPKLMDIKEAWRVNTIDKKIEKISVFNISCLVNTSNQPSPYK